MSKGEDRAEALGRILIVDDSPSSRRLLQDVLLRLGVTLPNLRVASTIPEALVTFTQWRPDLAIVDVELNHAPPPSGGIPPMATPPPSPSDPKDGAELVVLFRRRNPALRVVVCSATDPSDPRLKAVGKDARVEFVMKPVLAARLEDALSRISSAPERRAGRP
jgi:CheY-like chemotaxis protein